MCRWQGEPQWQRAAAPRARLVRGAAGWLASLILACVAGPAGAAPDAVYAALGATADSPSGARRGDPAQIADRLRAQGEHLELVDLTAPGASVRAILQTQLTRALASRPVLVTVALGPGDACGETPLSSFARDLEVLADFLQRSGATVVVSTIGRAQQLCGSSGPGMRERVDSFNFTIQREARRHHLLIADVRRPYLLRERCWVAAVERVMPPPARERTAAGRAVGAPRTAGAPGTSGKPRPVPDSA